MRERERVKEQRNETVCTSKTAFPPNTLLQTTRHHVRDVYLQIYPTKRRKRERGNVFLNKAHQALLDTVHMLAKNLKTHNSKNTRTHTRNLKGVYTHIRGGKGGGGAINCIHYIRNVYVLSGTS